MAKSSKKRKNAPEKVVSIAKKLKQDVPNTTAKPTSAANPGTTISDAVAQAGMIGGLIYEDELETTTETLLTLAQNPSLITLKALKPFKTAVHDYWRVAHETTNTGSSITSRISSALIDNRHVDALVLLSEMAIREQLPKLGALQRWVRECDAVLTPSMSQDEENRVWQVLDAILRTTQPELVASHEGGGKITKAGSRLRWFEPFGVDPCPSIATNEGKKGGFNPTPSPEAVEAAPNVLQPLQITPGPERRPPNKHPMTIYFSPPTEPTPFPLLTADRRPRQPTRHDVPGVPGAFIINDVLEQSECDALVQAAERIGMTADEPTSGSAVQLASILAHNFVWLADQEFIEGLYRRVVDLLPQEVNGGKVRGINRRFRLYRYRPGALYRPHIDGAWPSSALTSSSSTPPAYSYVYDSDPALYSRLTFLIYLNSSSSSSTTPTSPSSSSPSSSPSNFTGGCTTFFLPSSTYGILEARPVQPRAGTVCVFPHGGARGSLLHEGSGVLDGAKYVIRTEVLYEVDGSERVDVGFG